MGCLATPLLPRGICPVTVWLWFAEWAVGVGESLAAGRRDYPLLPFLAQRSAILQSKCEMNI